MARDALIKARAMESDIREADLTKERLKLERAIRKVEAEELEATRPRKLSYISLGTSKMCYPILPSLDGRV
jgi:hypothetical protein